MTHMLVALGNVFKWIPPEFLYSSLYDRAARRRPACRISTNDTLAKSEEPGGLKHTVAIIVL